MQADQSPILGIIPDVRGLGGPASFHQKFVAGLTKRNIRVSYDLTRKDLSAVLVIAGSKHLDTLYRVKRAGIPIIQRLDGLNYVHRHKSTGPRHFLRSEVNNWLMQTIRSRLTSRIIYQSWFSQSWWTRVYGALDKPFRIIYNGIDLEKYRPAEIPPALDRSIRLMTVEGHLKNGVETGLVNAVHALQYWPTYQNRPVRLAVAGDVPQSVRDRIDLMVPGRIDWLGILPREQIPTELHRSHLFFPVELNPACPNAVIEALACGLPVLAFDSGSIRELVDEHSGGILPYDADVWKLELASGKELPEVAEKIMGNLPEYRLNARKRAETMFQLDDMVESYLDFILQ
jgi:glycosyltransferase involved in cell wall biosynthesis